MLPCLSAHVSPGLWIECLCILVDGAGRRRVDHIDQQAVLSRSLDGGVVSNKARIYLSHLDACSRGRTRYRACFATHASTIQTKDGEGKEAGTCRKSKLCNRRT